MTNITRTMYRNCCTIKPLSPTGDGGYIAIGEHPVEYIDVAPFNRDKAIALSLIDGPVIVENETSYKVTFGMSVSDFLEHGHIIK